MVKKILMILLPVLAFVGGSFGGDMLRGGAAADAAATTPGEGAAAGDDVAAATGGGQPAPADAAAADAQVMWFGFANQFFVPIVRNGSTDSIMILTVSLEVGGGAHDRIAAMEARLRDALLRTLMIAANTGGFDGNFTTEARQEPLRAALLAAAQKVAGPEGRAVLIEDIARKEG